MDEAHCSQYGFSAKTNMKTGDVKYGYAKYLRDALPNASFIGFTGTPIELDDKSTPAVFGNYIDIYDLTCAVEDEATVRIYYENRIKQLAKDIVHHYEEKSKTIDGKAMVVCISRRICVALYNEIVSIRPGWHSDNEDKGKIKVVMTGSAETKMHYKHILVVRNVVIY